jgi:uroporphyrinogen-III synthase
VTQRPLVLVTRPAAADGRLAGLLEARGFEVVSIPTVATEPVPRGGPLDDAVARLGEYDWIVLTSAAGVGALADARRRLGLGPLRTSGHTKWAAVGQATARALEAAGGRPDVVPDTARAAALPAAMDSALPVAGTRILLARADAADRELPGALEAAGAVVEDIVAYQTIEAPSTSLEPIAAALADPRLVGAVVASGSAARGLLRLAERSARLAEVRRLRLVSIGPSTSRAVREIGLEVAAEAQSPDPESLAAAVAAALPVEAIP